MERYLPALLTGLFTVIGWAVTYGTQLQATRANTSAIRRLDGEQDDQWSYIHDTREQVAKVKGHLGINGDSQPLPPAPRPRVKAAHA